MFIVTGDRTQGRERPGGYGLHFHVGSRWLFSFYSQTRSPTAGARAGPGGGRCRAPRRRASSVRGAAQLGSGGAQKCRRRPEHGVDSALFLLHTEPQRPRAVFAGERREAWGLLPCADASAQRRRGAGRRVCPHPEPGCGHCPAVQGGGRADWGAVPGRRGQEGGGGGQCVWGWSLCGWCSFSLMSLFTLPGD